MFKIIQRHAFREFATAIQDAVFAQLTADPRIAAFYPNSYAFCGLSVMKKSRAWASGQGLRLPMKSIFEDGDTGWGALEDRAMQDGHSRPSRQPATPKKPGNELLCLTPLQAGDFAAYEILQYYRIAREGDQDRSDARESLRLSSKRHRASGRGACQWTRSSSLRTFVRWARGARSLLEPVLAQPMPAFVWA